MWFCIHKHINISSSIFVNGSLTRLKQKSKGDKQNSQTWHYRGGLLLNLLGKSINSWLQKWDQSFTCRIYCIVFCLSSTGRWKIQHIKSEWCINFKHCIFPVQSQPWPVPKHTVWKCLDQRHVGCLRDR